MPHRLRGGWLEQQQCWGMNAVEEGRWNATFGDMLLVKRFTNNFSHNNLNNSSAKPVWVNKG